MAKLKWLIPVLVVFNLLYSCSGGEFKTELAMLDSADEELEEMSQWLHVDAATVKERFEHMRTNDSVFHRKFQDTVTIQLSQALDLYKGIFKIYEMYLKHHAEIEKEHKELSKQFRDLRSALLSGKINRQDFRVYYQREMEDMEKLEENIEAVSKRVIEVEPNYNRITPALDSICAGLVTK